MKMDRRILIGISILIVVVLVFVAQTNKTIKNIEWSCSGSLCEIQMVVQNTSNYRITNRIVIRAHNQERHDRDPGAKGNKVVGEKYLNVDLDANEERELTELLQLYYPARVHMLVAKSIQAQRM